MARIRWIAESEAAGDVAAAYAEWLAANPGRPKVPEILKCFSLRPDVLRTVELISEQVHFTDGHLSRRVKEMIATYVSAMNRCPY